jgi:MSHA biogenesis protein MshL
MSNDNPTRGMTCKCMFLMLAGAFILPLSGCDLAKNQLKTDRSTDMEFQDYRDALAQRQPEVKDKKKDEAGIPALKQYMATPNDKLKPMPLVSVAVNQSVPVKDVLYEAAEQAGYDIELDPRIRGSIIFTARNRPFDEVVDKISESAGLRYKFSEDSVKVELDTPYHEIYKINYLSYIRANSSTVNNDVSVVSGGGTDTGSKFTSEAKSESNFWGELEANLTQILGVNRDAGTLRTKKDPKITAVAETPAPVEPVLLTADGEIAQGQNGQGAQGQNGAAPAQNVQVAAPEAVLKVEPLAVEEEEPEGNSSGEDPFAPRYSINKQAGVISVFATERQHKQIGQYLDAIRKASTSQVLIEAKVLEVSLSDEFAAGIDWSATGLFNNRLSFGVDTVGEALAPVLNPAPDPSTGFAIAYASGDLDAAVDALSRFGTVHALASPRLTVLNNQSAVLNVAKNQVYFELDVNTSQTDSGTTVDVDSNIRNVPEGVLINVQPSIDLDNETIAMAVRPTVTRITSFVNDPAVTFAVADAGLTDAIESPVPVVNVQEFDSVIQVNNGQPIVMGGLIQDRTASTQVGVPVLSEVPVFGGLFRNQSDKVEKTELVVLMKATIVEGGNNIHNTDKDLYRGFGQDRRPFDM